MAQQNETTEQWVNRMVQEDPVYREWHDAYTGKTDNGVTLPVRLVIPGVILNGKAVGYWPSSSPAESVRPWLFQNIELKSPVS